MAGLLIVLLRGPRTGPISQPLQALLRRRMRHFESRHCSSVVTTQLLKLPKSVSVYLETKRWFPSHG